MDVYFAGSIRGSRIVAQAQYNKHILAAIRDAGHNIISEHTLVTDKHHMETWSEQDIYKQDYDWLINSQAVIAECSAPSHGVGYEIGVACMHEIPVMAVYLRGEKISAMLAGNPHVQVHAYGAVQELESLVRAFLRRTQEDYGD